MSIRIFILMLFADSFFMGQVPADASIQGIAPAIAFNKILSKLLKKAAICDPSIKLVKEGLCDKEGSSKPINHCSRACPEVIYPVCGSDWKTYDNDCELKIATCMNPSIKLVTRGRCGKFNKGIITRRCSRPCPRIKRPVCGNNGFTYDNICLLKIAICMNPTIKQVKEGTCPFRPFPINMIPI